MASFRPIRKIRKIARRNALNFWYYRRYLADRTFQLGGKDYPYVYHWHNFTWLNERAVELSVARDWIGRFQRGQVLEVGNVTSHYFPVSHKVVDKYERGPRVINEDIVDYQCERNYDFVFAISTIEHVGWDRDQREPGKIPRALSNMVNLLRPGGTLLVTVPIGFNPYLDKMLADQTVCFSQQAYLRRISADNQWRESSWQEVRTARYNDPYDHANAILVGVHRKAA